MARRNSVGNAGSSEPNGKQWPTAVVTQSVDVGPQFAGKKLRVRLRITTDPSGIGVGWNVDDVSFTGLTNTPFFDVGKDRAICVNRPARTRSV